jgi:hypothetical protein
LHGWLVAELFNALEEGFLPCVSYALVVFPRSNSVTIEIDHPRTLGMTGPVHGRGHPAERVPGHNRVPKAKRGDDRFHVVCVRFEADVTLVRRIPMPAEVHRHHPAARKVRTH